MLICLFLIAIDVIILYKYLLRIYILYIHLKKGDEIMCPDCIFLLKTV